MSYVESVKASVSCHVITLSVSRPCSILNFILVYIVYDGFERIGVDFVAFLLFGSCTFRYATNFFLHMLVMMRKHFESWNMAIHSRKVCSSRTHLSLTTNYRCFYFRFLGY